jgi:hypothetical protein
MGSSGCCDCARFQFARSSLPVQRRPFRDHAEHARRHLAAQDAERLDLDQNPTAAVPRMEVWRVTALEHADHDSEEAADLRHPPVSVMSLRPVPKLPRSDNSYASGELGETRTDRVFSIAGGRAPTRGARRRPASLSTTTSSSPSGLSSARTPRAYHATSTSTRTTPPACSGSATTDRTCSRCAAREHRRRRATSLAPSPRRMGTRL